MKTSDNGNLALSIISYVRVYFPDFPPEDCTNLDNELARVASTIGEAQKNAKTSVRRHAWFLAGGEVEKAWNSLRAGDQGSGIRHLDPAAAHVAQAVSGVLPQAGFIVSSDGTVTGIG